MCECVSECCLFLTTYRVTPRTAQFVGSTPGLLTVRYPFRIPCVCVPMYISVVCVLYCVCPAGRAVLQLEWVLVTGSGTTASHTDGTKTDRERMVDTYWKNVYCILVYQCLQMRGGWVCSAINCHVRSPLTPSPPPLTPSPPPLTPSPPPPHSLSITPHTPSSSRALQEGYSPS